MAQVHFHIRDPRKSSNSNDTPDFSPGAMNERVSSILQAHEFKTALDYAHFEDLEMHVKSQLETRGVVKCVRGDASARYWDLVAWDIGLLLFQDGRFSIGSLGIHELSLQHLRAAKGDTIPPYPIHDATARLLASVQVTDKTQHEGRLLRAAAETVSDIRPRVRQSYQNHKALREDLLAQISESAIDFSRFTRNANRDYKSDVAWQIGHAMWSLRWTSLKDNPGLPRIRPTHQNKGMSGNRREDSQTATCKDREGSARSTPLNGIPAANTSFGNDRNQERLVQPLVTSTTSPQLRQREEIKASKPLELPPSHSEVEEATPSTFNEDPSPSIAPPDNTSLNA
ncbi:hypothetical protein CC80DRAFT_509125 [Byssothecium circinans]|uniref:Uncharacterized protein n=1 Tax=Byssothecium circinans TaxID=147558 RepID=A0A6A5TEM3_9PLEO|nr:hypothetical protein CC80DRAFT_509125 [Byssothecium circinans]